PERFDLGRGIAFRSTWRDGKGLSVDIDAVIVGNRSRRECLRLSHRRFDAIDAMPTMAPIKLIDFPWRVLIPFSTVARPRRGLILTRDVARLSSRRQEGADRSLCQPAPANTKGSHPRHFAVAEIQLSSKAFLSLY